MFCSTFSQFRMFCDDNPSKLVPDSTWSGGGFELNDCWRTNKKNKSEHWTLERKVKHLKDKEQNAEYTRVEPYLNMDLELLLKYDDRLQYARVKKRSVIVERRPGKVANENPMIDSRQYIIEYLDRETEILTAKHIS